MTISTGGTETYIERNSLRMAVSDKTTRALRTGALQPISTTTQWINDHGVDFVVRVLDDQAGKRTGRDSNQAVYPQPNPFLPCDSDLFVADISATHRCLLNKFTVLTDHLLIVTRDFEHQETWLTRQDFQALWACMAEFDGLGFYNGGFAAGASQPHKHLQYVPFPLVSVGPDIPIETLLPTGRPGVIQVSNALPFLHGFVRFDHSSRATVVTKADESFDAYGSLLASVGMDIANVEIGGRQSGAYNMLMTRNWMLIVPRSQAGFAGISVNALGFAGHLLARNQQQVETIRQNGPLGLLRHVGRRGWQGEGVTR